MKTARLLLIVMAVAALAACSSHDRKPQFETPTPEKRLYTLKHRLNMTDEQVAAVKPIIEEEHKRKQELMEAMDDGDREAMRENKEKMEDLEWDIFKKLSKHLTPDQMDLYSKLLEEEAKAMEEQSRPGPGGGRPGGGRGRGPM